VKGTGWLAGFPVMNSVMPGDSVSHFDFLGSSIDIGFRLSRFASPRKFIFSVELAYVLSAPGKLIENGFRYHGKEILKGVLANRPYPIFWLDCFVGCPKPLPQFVKLALLEDEMTNEHGKSFERIQMGKFTAAWIDSTEEEIARPFCPGETSKRFPIPEDYEEKRESALAELEREFLELGELGLDEGDDEDFGQIRDKIDDF